MVYLIVFDVRGNAQPRWGEFPQMLRKLGARRVHEPYVWLLHSEKSAPELYLELEKGLDLPHMDLLFIAEITANSIGSYFVAGRHAPDSGVAADAIATLIGKARRD